MQKHGLDIFQRQRGFTVDLFRPRAVSEKGKEQTELAGGSDQIVFAGESSQLLLELSVGSLMIGSAETREKIETRARDKVVKVPRQELRCRWAKHFRFRIPVQVAGDKLPYIRTLDQPVDGKTREPLKVRNTKPAGIQLRRVSLQNATVPRMGTL